MNIGESLLLSQGFPVSKSFVCGRAYVSCVYPVPRQMFEVVSYGS